MSEPVPTGNAASTDPAPQADSTGKAASQPGESGWKKFLAGIVGKNLEDLISKLFPEQCRPTAQAATRFVWERAGPTVVEHAIQAASVGGSALGDGVSTVADCVSGLVNRSPQALPPATQEQKEAPAVNPQNGAS